MEDNHSPNHQQPGAGGQQPVYGNVPPDLQRPPDYRKQQHEAPRPESPYNQGPAKPQDVRWYPDPNQASDRDAALAFIKKYAKIIVPGVALAAFAWWVLSHPDHGKEARADLGKSAVFLFQVLVLTASSLIVVLVTQWARSLWLFDDHGASSELRKVRERVGTPGERPGDATATAIQWFSTTALIIGVLVAYFGMH